MISQDILQVHCRRQENGNFFIWANNKFGNSTDPYHLKRILFAWDRRSFYGTMIEIAENKRLVGLSLSPLSAFHYFSAPTPSLYAKIIWDNEILIQQKAAKFFEKSLENKSYQPSLSKWLEGKAGWEQALDHEQDLAYQEILAESDYLNIKYIDDWFDAIVPQKHPKESEIKAKTHGKTHNKELNNLWNDQEEWLISIGWKEDPTPFRLGLQLREPENDENWTIRFVLQDYENENIIVETNLQGVPFESEIPTHWIEYVEQKITNTNAKIAQIVPWLKTDAPSLPIKEELSDDEAWEMMNEASISLIQAGLTVYLPAWWEEIKAIKPKLKAKVKSSSAGSTGKSMFGLNQIMDFDWKLAVGKIELSEADFMTMLKEKKRMMNIKGNWIQLDPKLLNQLQVTIKQMKKNKGLSMRDVLESYLIGAEEDESTNEQKDSNNEQDESGASLRFEVELNSQLRQMMKQLEQSAKIEPIDPPKTLNANLRTYQLEGVSWLLFLRKLGLGGVLADDMGLGKTIQFITYLLSIKEEERAIKLQPALLICPTSVLGNWQKELNRFAPSLSVHLHYGSQRYKGEEFAEKVKDVDLVITSYTLANLDYEELSSVEWDVIGLDEAQNIKNAYTKQSTAIRNLSASHRIALTGTPIENRLTELWSIFDFINPGYLGSIRAFNKKYVIPIEKENDKLRIGQVHRLVRPFLLRRTKKDSAIQLDLPDKNENKVYLSLTGEQAALYENTVQELLKEIEHRTGIEKKGMILSTLTKLKQITDHPALFLKSNPKKAEKDSSQKVDRLLEMIEEIRDEGEKCLIFTQFVGMGELLKTIIERERGESVLFLHGGIAKEKRDKMIDQFQDPSNSEEKGIFILSLKAGGTGLNLTAANHVFHIDRWWNPAVENQATDRAFRIGQTKDVQVHKFVTLGTLEERIDEMLDYKQGLSDQIVGTGEGWITELSTNELKELLLLRKSLV